MSPWIEVKPTDRQHMTVWRAHPSGDTDPGWRVSRALNGIPVGFGRQCDTWQEALDIALWEIGEDS